MGLDDPQRARFLAAQLDGLAATAERLAGQPLPYAEEVQRSYGIAIRRVDDAAFAKAFEELERLIPGTGPLVERYQAWRGATEIPTGALSEVLPSLRSELERRTEELFGLPDGQSAEVVLTANQPWLGFNYYLGGLKSRIAINTDVAMQAEFLVILLSHEIYPGHHTEHSWKEHLLVRRGRLDESIFLIGTPQCLVSEGIASYALEALGGEAEDACAEVLASAGHGYDVELSRAVRDVKRRLAPMEDNAAMMLHEEHADRETVRKYMRRWSVEPDELIDKKLDFILHPVWRAYNAVYGAGHRAVAAWTAGEPARFRRLLTEQLTSADLLAPERF